MNIVGLLWENLRRGVMTVRFPARPPVSQGYRGLVLFDPEHCVGCAICRFRCTSGAITFEAGRTEFTWSYDPGRCTFCGRCVEGCREHALSQECACPPIYNTAGALRRSWTVARRAPARKTSVPSAAERVLPTGDGL